MSTRGRRRQIGTSRVPADPNIEPVPVATVGSEPAAKKQAKTKTRVPVARRGKIVATPVKRRVPAQKRTTSRVPKRGTTMISDNESENSQVVDERELSVLETESEDESQTQIEQLRKQLAELEANQESRNPLKSKRSRAVPETGTFRESSSPEKRGNPAEGRSLGTFNGRTDLDTFLVRFEKCGKHFGWSKSEKVFHLMNALTDSAEPIVKEVGPDGTLETILELLQGRFGNQLRLEKFHADLRNRKRGRNEPLQELYLDLCRLRALASGDSSDEKFPEKYFKNIFVDALNDREFRRAVLVQNPGTMEEAYRVATQLEAIDAYNTPVPDSSHVKPRVRQLDCRTENSRSSVPIVEQGEAMARRLEELESEVQNLRANAQRQASWFPNEPSNRPVRPSVQDPAFKMTSGSTRDGSAAHSTHENNVPIGRGKQAVRQGPRSCFNCGGIGHFSRDCKKPKYFEIPKSRETQVSRPDGYPGKNDQVPGTSSGTMNGLSTPSKIRREAYLEVKLGTRRILALLDSGCEQSVIGRNLIKKVPLEPTSEKLSTADGTNIPLLGETTIEFSVSDCTTSCRVVVTDAITELILGIEWLQRNQCVWDFGSNSFAIKGTQGRLRCRRVKRTLRKIVLGDDVEIPGMHTTNVTVLVTRTSLNHECQNWGLVRKIKDADLVVANAVYDNNDLNSVCQILNISDKPKKLRKGSELGWAEPIEVMGTDEIPVSGPKQKASELENTGPYFDDLPWDLRCLKGIEGRGLSDSDSEGSELLQGNSSTSSQDPGTEPTDFIQEMIQKIDLDLTDEQKHEVERLLQDHKEVFSTSEFDLGRTNLVQHKIDTGTNRPFKQQLRRHPMAYLPVIDEHVDKMLANDVCEPSVSPWASNVVLVKKSDGTLRFCVDYRQLNNLTTKDSYPLPRIDTCFDALGGARYFSTLDLRQGYWQVENDPESSDKTTFITRKGSFKFKVLPFGLSNAPAVFQRLMNMVMQGLTWEACLVFLDDIIVISSTFEQHLERLSAVFQRLKAANLKLKPSKCRLFQIKVKFLGSVVSADGIEPDPDKLKAISDWPIPENLTELRAFVGLASYYRRHVEGFSDIAKPLSELTKKNRPFAWGPEQQKAFETLKYKLTHYPVLAPPLPEGKYIIDTDASDFAMGAVLQQEQFGTVRVIAYASKTFDASERMYLYHSERTRCSYLCIKRVPTLCSWWETFLVKNRPWGFNITV